MTTLQPSQQPSAAGPSSRIRFYETGGYTAADGSMYISSGEGQDRRLYQLTMDGQILANVLDVGRHHSLDSIGQLWLDAHSGVLFCLLHGITADDYTDKGDYFEILEARVLCYYHWTIRVYRSLPQGLVLADASGKPLEVNDCQLPL